MSLQPDLPAAETNRTPGLVTRSRPEPDDQFSWYATTILDLDALRLSPLTNLSGVKATRRRPAPAPGGTAGSAATASSRGVNVPGQRLPQRFGVLSVQVDLILRTI